MSLAWVKFPFDFKKPVSPFHNPIPNRSHSSRAEKKILPHFDFASFHRKSPTHHASTHTQKAKEKSTRKKIAHAHVSDFTCDGVSQHPKNCAENTYISPLLLLSRKKKHIKTIISRRGWTTLLPLIPRKYQTTTRARVMCVYLCVFAGDSNTLSTRIPPCTRKKET